MEKPLYNQGDLLQFQHQTHGPTHLLVITDVFTNGRHERGNVNTYYTFTWCDDGSKNTYQINTLDDDLSFKLLARGQ